jgi:glycosyltransferase involved in cell wall biosynthesis
MMAFADWFTELGHDVRFLSDFSNPDPSRGWTQNTFLGWFPFSHLRYEQFEWSVRKRSMVPPEHWKQFDLLLGSYGHWGYLVKHLPRTRVVTWVILPEQKRMDLHEVWTNSVTSLGRLADSEWRHSPTKIVRPPHDYSEWRSRSAPREDRDTDVLVCGSLIHAKGIVEAVDAATGCGASVQVIGTAWDAVKSENEDVLAALDRRGIPTKVNVGYKEVAKAMGRSKVYFSMSRAESCSLAVYEALNAGCSIVAREVGAVKEQVGTDGVYFREDEDAPMAIRNALLADHDPNLSMKRGLIFDRRVVGRESKEALESA